MGRSELENYEQEKGTTFTISNFFTGSITFDANIHY
jgi:hypothetical protein